MHIIDDILPYHLHQQMIDLYDRERFHAFKYTNDLTFAERRLIDHAQKFFNLASMVGTEIWSNVNEVVPHWHVDKDEKLHEETGQMSYPLCTILYYPIVDDNLEGGRITLYEENSVVITPKTNRVVFFSSDIPHIVEPFNGKRVSVVSCPFSYNPL